MSSSKRALVHEVIPFIDLLTEHLDKFRNDEDLPPVVRAAAYRGRALLDKYYTLTDDSIVYRIAMSECAVIATLGLWLTTSHTYSPPPAL